MSSIFKNLINLHMTAREHSAQVAVGWTALDGTRSHVWLEVAKNEATGRSEPLIPYRVRIERPMGHKTSKAVLYRNPLIRADGTHPSRGDPDYFPTRYLDANAAANALLVEEALRRAQAGGLYEKALADSVREDAEHEAKRRAEKATKMRDDLDKRRDRDGVSPAALIAMNKLLEMGDDDLLNFCHLG